jgi:guanylate kinase
MKKNEQYLVMDIRGDMQAFDINELLELLEKSNVLFEGNTLIGKKLVDLPQIDVQNKLSIFLSPLSKAEIINLKSSPVIINLADFVKEMMRMKLVNRAKKFNQEITPKVSDNINKRAADAYQELKIACQFNYIIPNRDGEDSENWKQLKNKATDAYKALQTFTLLLIGGRPKHAEKWPENLLS